MKKKSSSIDLAEKPFDSKLKGEWEGYYHNNLIFLDIYLKNNYKDDVFIDPFTTIFMSETPFLNKYKFGIIDDITGKNHPYDSTSKNSPIYKKFFSSVRNRNNRFSYFQISHSLYIYDEEIREGHAMSFLYDKKSNEVEMFDSSNTHYHLKFKKKIIKFFTEIYGNKVKIIFPEFCLNLTKLQTECDLEGGNYKSKGFCIIWNLWYLEMRLRNKKLSRQEVLYKAVKSLKNDKEKICRTIKGYAQFVNSLTKNYIIFGDRKTYIFIYDKKSFIDLPIKLIKSIGLQATIVHYLKQLIFKKN